MGVDVIQLDINPSELGRSYPIKLGVHGVAQASLRKMIEQSEIISPNNEWLSSVQKHVSDWGEEVYQYVDSEEIPMSPERLCRELGIGGLYEYTELKSINYTGFTLKDAKMKRISQFK